MTPRAGKGGQVPTWTQQAPSARSFRRILSVTWLVIFRGSLQHQHRHATWLSPFFLSFTPSIARTRQTKWRCASWTRLACGYNKSTKKEECNSRNGMSFSIARLTLSLSWPTICYKINYPSKIIIIAITTTGQGQCFKIAPDHHLIHYSFFPFFFLALLLSVRKQKASASRWR